MPPVPPTALFPVIVPSRDRHVAAIDEQAAALAGAALAARTADAAGFLAREVEEADS